MPRVRFVKVGRNKLTWEEEVANIDSDSLVRCIKRKGALMSNSIEVHDSTIYVGGFRPVGTTELVDAGAGA